MTDALKMTDMQQRASIEFERQRHLANWLIESSPHMPNPTAAQQKQLQQHQQQLQQQQQAQLQQQLAAAAAAASAAAAAATGNAGGKKQFAGGKFKPNPMFLLAKIGQNLAPGGGAVGAAAAAAGTAPLDGSLAAASTFNSQTNLPLQILQPGGGGRDGGKPKLRRFNSHDTSANMFSVAEFENARMARRNELENAALLRQRQRYKLNSLNSSGGGGGGGDCSTGESKGSKLSTESLTEPLVADQFLDRFSLPRVIRLTYTSSSNSSSGSAVSGTAAAAAVTTGVATGDHTMTSSSSAESSSTAERGGGGGSKAKSKKATKAAAAAASNSTGTTTTTTTAAGGDLFLLYRYMKSYKSYHVFNTKAGTSRKKGYKIPQDFPGYFSFINDKGAATATIYTTIVQLVRDQVYKFLSLENLAAYTESHDNFSHKAHYVKATAKAGQVYRLLAVFQDGDHKTASSHKDSTGSASDRHVSGREKERGKYAQLLDDNRQIYYVSLSAKGKFYEIEQHSAPVLQKPLGGGGQFGQLGGAGNLQQGSLTGGSASSSSINNQLHRKPGAAATAAPARHLSRDCVHRIGFIMQSDVSLPVNLRLISPQGGPHSTVPEYVTIAKISEENFIVACPLDEQQLTSTLTLTKLHLAPQMKFTKCTMGFESEQHMLLNPNVQTVLKFCQFNCDNFLRIVDHDTNAIELQQMVAMASASSPTSAGGHHSTGGSTVNVSPSTTLTTGPSSLVSSASGQHQHHREPKSEMLKVFGRLFGGGGGGSGGGSGGGHDRHSGSGHEKEDSIIFLSKNDLESLECSGREAIEAEHQQHQQQQQQQHLDHHHHHHSLGDRSVRSYDGQGREMTNQQPLSLPALSASGGFSEKMKVFTPNGGVAGGKKTSSTSRWFKGLGRSVTGGGGGGGHQGNGPVSADDEWDKRTSLDRYKDMSKLIQERFGTLAVSSRAHSDILGGYDDTGAAPMTPMSATGTLVSLNPAASSADMTSGGYGSDTLVSGGSGGGSLGMQKSRSLQHIEHQQQHMARGQKGRNRPDLVTNLSGSVDGDTIHTFDPDDADRLSELEGDTLIFPLRHSSHQQSFMTQKLYNEFHVKTKQHSKSSSSIQQLLHLASGGHGGQGKALSKQQQRASGRGQQRHCNEVILSFDDLRYMNSEEAEEAQQQERPVRSSVLDASRRMRQAESRMSAPLPAPPKVLEDDLPYSSVRDSIMIHDDARVADDGESVPTESIYAEICADHGPTMVPGSIGGEGHSSPTATTSSGCSTGSTGSSNSSSNGNRMASSLTGNQHTVTISTGGGLPLRPSEKRFVSIRINVPPCDSIDAGPVSLNPAGGATVTVRGGSTSNSSNSSRCSSTVSSPIEDNIYNTIK